MVIYGLRMNQGGIRKSRVLLVLDPMPGNCLRGR